VESGQPPAVEGGEWSWLELVAEVVHRVNPTVPTHWPVTSSNTPYSFVLRVPTPFKFEAHLWILRVPGPRVDRSWPPARRAGRPIRSVTTMPAKQHDKRQRDEGENRDRDGRAAGHSV